MSVRRSRNCTMPWGGWRLCRKSRKRNEELEAETKRQQDLNEQWKQQKDAAEASAANAVKEAHESVDAARQLLLDMTAKNAANEEQVRVLEARAQRVESEVAEMSELTTVARKLRSWSLGINVSRTKS